MSRIEQDRRGVEQVEALVELRNRGLDHLRGPAMCPVRAVGADGYGIELRCAGHGGSPTAP
jgi:hypothetical protein